MQSKLQLIITLLTLLLSSAACGPDKVLPPADCEFVLVNKTDEPLTVSVKISGDNFDTVNTTLSIPMEGEATVLSFRSNGSVYQSYDNLYGYITDGTVSIYREGHTDPSITWTTDDLGNGERNFFCRKCKDETENSGYDPETRFGHIRFLFYINKSDLD